MRQFIEALEARELLSATPMKTAHKASATIVADQATILIARNKIRDDQASNRAALVADRQSIPTVRRADQSIIRQDTIKLRQDRGNSIAVQADRGQILIDRSTLRQHVQLGQARIKADAGAGRTLILTDRQALRADQTQLRDDRIAHL